MKSSSKVVTLKKLLSLIKPHLSLFISAMVALGIGSAINLLFPEIIRRVLNSPDFKSYIEHPWALGGLLIFLFAFQALCFYIRIYFFSIIGLKVVNALRTQLFRILLHRDVELFDSGRTGDFLSRLSADTALMQDAVSVKLSVIIRYSLQVLIGIALMAYMSLTLTISIVLALSVLIFLSMLLGKRLRYYSKQLQGELGKATTLAEEALLGIRVVKAFAIEGFLYNIFERSNNKILSIGTTRSIISAFFQSFVNFLMNGCLVVVLLYGIYLASHDSLSFGDLTSFLLYGVIVAVSFSFAISCYGELMTAIGGAERVFEFLDEETPSPITEVKKLSSVTGHIEFRNVSFAYPTRREIHALDQVSCDIPPGKVTALIGSSGSGKSTLISLILKFYVPNSGAVLLDGTDIQNIDSHAVREHIAIVPQDSKLFGLTIYENLTLVKDGLTKQDLTEACRKAGILEFIEGLPLGFDTPLGDNAVQISGGQRQRIAIARAILKDPKILILDEATSSLDAENERLVQDALHELMKRRTTIVIAHRLSTIKSADNIVVLNKGKVVQQGAASKLISEAGPYREFVKLQEFNER